MSAFPEIDRCRCVAGRMESASTAITAQIVTPILRIRAFSKIPSIRATSRVVSRMMPLHPGLARPRRGPDRIPLAPRSCGTNGAARGQVLPVCIRVWRPARLGSWWGCPTRRPRRPPCCSILRPSSRRPSPGSPSANTMIGASRPDGADCGGQRVAGRHTVADSNAPGAACSCQMVRPVADPAYSRRQATPAARCQGAVSREGC